MAGGRIGLGAIVVLGVILNLSNVPGLLAFLPNAIVGSLLVIRQPGHLIGWLLLLMAAGFSIVGHPIEVSAVAIATGKAPWLPVEAWLGTMVAIGLFGGLALLSAVFPSGALPSGGVGRTTRVAFALIVGMALLQALDPAYSNRATGRDDGGGPQPDRDRAGLARMIAPRWTRLCRRAGRPHGLHRRPSGPLSTSGRDRAATPIPRGSMASEGRPMRDRWRPAALR